MALFNKEWFDTLVYIVLLFITIESDLKIEQKIVNNLKIENIFPSISAHQYKIGDICG